MYLTRNTEKKYIRKGYHFSKNFECDYARAKNYAYMLRKSGYNAFVGEYSTRVHGYHVFAVWCKKKTNI